MKLGWSAVLLVAVAAGAQTTGVTGAAQAGAAGSPAVQTYTNPELHLTFQYPADLTPRDTAEVTLVGRRMMYGGDEEADPGHPKPDTCTKVLLSVGKGNEGSGKAGGVWVRVGLLDVDARCFPAQVFRNKKTIDPLLRNLVKQGTTVMGMMPLEQPAAYGIQGHRTSFCAAQGQPLTGTDLQTGDEQMMGVVVVAVEGHLVGWVLETSDAAIFNQLLGSVVDLGGGKPERLFPGQVGQGTGSMQ
ncbi:MAG TPA: hypothetical protein VHZ25_13125 [Acidobacteriaceae bacterium]|jgi:hypothetical protein|nr:hypothetical protein [Acidobacteriaceae bacterium]